MRDEIDVIWALRHIYTKSQHLEKPMSAFREYQLSMDAGNE